MGNLRVAGNAYPHAVKAGRSLWRRGARRVRRSVGGGARRGRLLAYLAVLGPGIIAATG